MKTIKKIVMGGALVLALTTNAFAIEGIQVSVQSSNVVLSWPSDPSEAYVVQYRPSLTSTNGWQTLTNAFAAAADTNVTYFVHSNSIDFGSSLAVTYGTNSSSGGPMPPGGTNSASGTNGVIFIPGTGFYQAARLGVHIYGMTNGMVVGGTVQLPLEIALDTTNEIAGITFYADGNPLIGATTDGAGYQWFLDWDTTMMPNGTYDITAKIDFVTQTDETNSLPVTVTVQNAISFPNYFTRNFGDQMWIYAELDDAESDFQIDMYEDDTNYLGSFSGSTTDGVISFLWDLTDGDGDPVTGANLSGVFTVSPSFSGSIRPLFSSTSTATNFWAAETNWPTANNDYYVVAYGPFDTGNAAAKQLLTMLGGGDGTYGGVIHTLNPYNLSGHLSPGNVDQSTAFALSDGTAKTNLLNYLANPAFRSFYFFGHGGPSAIGGVDPTSIIRGTDIQKALHNFMNSPKPADYHPYRFVFIDGCDAGSGNFCENFGIPAIKVGNSFFSTAGVRSRAFLGFTSLKSYNPSEWDWYALMIGGFYDDFMAGFTINTCMNNAIAGSHDSAIVTMSSSAVIYGASDMRHSSP
ncbi:MAG TPA: Ig-like domain-containing protein [Verrucomicrobiae bacterium]|nr:Ig-like domain-containing protein [Verrucomicrobiae bacterium]